MEEFAAEEHHIQHGATHSNTSRMRMSQPTCIHLVKDPLWSGSPPGWSMIDELLSVVYDSSYSQHQAGSRINAKSDRYTGMSGYYYYPRQNAPGQAGSRDPWTIPATNSSSDDMQPQQAPVPSQEMHDQSFQGPSNTVFVPLEPVSEFPHRSYVATPEGSTPGLNFNGYVLEPAAKPIPEELIREPTGTSIAEPGSIFDEESGRTYYNHHTGKYFFPNDPVRVRLWEDVCRPVLCKEPR